MRNNEERVVLWALDKKIKINNITNILNLDYSIEVDYLSNHDIGPNDKKLLNNWEFEEIKEYNGVKFIKSKAIIEKKVPEEKAFLVINGKKELLPKNRRINSYSIPVYFIEYKETVYSVTKCCKYLESTLRGSLMGQSNKTNNHLKSAWKNIQSNKIPKFYFNSDFFFWIINLRNQILATTIGDIEILDIKNVADYDKEKSKGHHNYGDNILNDATTKTAIGIKNNLEMIGLHLKSETIDCHFSIDKNSKILLNNKSYLLENEEIIPYSEQNLYKYLINTYFFIIPSLVDEYVKEKANGDWTTSISEKKYRKWAIESIEMIAKELGIELIKNYEDLKQIRKIKIEK